MHNKIVAILEARGKAGVPVQDYIIEASQGGDRIAFWNSDKLGPVPSEAELAAVAPAAAAAEASRVTAKEAYRAARQRIIDGSEDLKDIAAVVRFICGGR